MTNNNDFSNMSIEELKAKLTYLTRKKSILEKRLSRIKIDIELKGAICFKYIKCGKKKCHCVLKGEEHGPYPHLQWWENDKIKTKYLNKKNFPIYEKELNKNKNVIKLIRKIEKTKKELRKLEKYIQKTEKKLE